MTKTWSERESVRLRPEQFYAARERNSSAALTAQAVGAATRLLYGPGCWVGDSAQPGEAPVPFVFVNTVRIENVDQAREALQTEVIPGVKLAPGFIRGIWSADRGT